MDERAYRLQLCAAVGRCSRGSAACSSCVPGCQQSCSAARLPGLTDRTIQIVARRKRRARLAHNADSYTSMEHCGSSHTIAPSLLVSLSTLAASPPRDKGRPSEPQEQLQQDRKSKKSKIPQRTHYSHRNATARYGSAGSGGLTRSRTRGPASAILASRRRRRANRAPPARAHAPRQSTRAAGAP